MAAKKARYVLIEMIEDELDKFSAANLHSPVAGVNMHALAVNIADRIILEQKQSLGVNPKSKFSPGLVISPDGRFLEADPNKS